MNVKNILNTFLALAFLGCSNGRDADTDQPQVINGQVLVESNDAGQDISISEDEYYSLLGEDFTTSMVSFFDFKKSFTDVASYITQTVEQEFDIFLIVNVAPESRFNKDHEIPAQNMKVIRRTQENQLLFKRNGKGQVVGILKDVSGNNGKGAFSNLSALMPISSGAGHFSPGKDGQEYVDTPTGIYRIQFKKSDTQRYSVNEKNQRVMWHSLYFDLIYPSGNYSGLAIHGTSTNQYTNLGSQRSHGCVRTTQEQANSIYENLINDDFFWSDKLPDMNNKSRLKAELRDNGVLKTRGGVRAIIMTFYGYDKSF